jgi:hypothetical protein
MDKQRLLELAGVPITDELKDNYLTEKAGTKYIVYQSDDNGRQTGDPLGCIAIDEKSDDWMKNKRQAVQEFLSKHQGVPQDKIKDAGWHTAHEFDPKESKKKVRELEKSLAAYKACF